MNSGIYEIRNMLNNKIYIGSSINIKSRIKRHFNDLKKGSHHSLFLQRSFNKHGSENFSYRIIEITSQDNLLPCEQFYLDTLKPAYNISKNAGNTLGIKHSPEVVERNRLRNSGFGNGNSKITPENLNEILELRKNLSVSDIASSYGVHITTIERVIKKHSSSIFGKVYDKNSRHKISNSKKKNNYAGKTVYRVNVGGTIVEVHASMTDAAKFAGISLATMKYGIENNIKRGMYFFKMAS
ncbi:GIY-YIG nuclease family protein [Psychrobacter aquaticus]|uniref:GIY-YIG catalytic domain containing protein n=1 Tax=Psychrobacter aquaticus CMS 56 TaxID=1354303 RepID=U4T908_9GAMM|nr:GIY-YIG nuclease family protein [Psychrobacter aquaticus]ERL54968.1 GIY-YIG catalytic domain containing protein [Psychrobacter aquaticus CMS 56]